MSQYNTASLSNDTVFNKILSISGIFTQFRVKINFPLFVHPMGRRPRFTGEQRLIGWDSHKSSPRVYYIIINYSISERVCQAINLLSPRG